jgi:hypothetical protein
LEIIAHSRVASTRAAYDRVWNNWSEFCERYGHDPWRPPAEAVLNFLAWLDVIGNGASASRAIAAMRAKWKDSGCEDFSKNHQVGRMLEALSRLAAIEKIERAERLPLPASAITSWCSTKPPGTLDWIWKRDAAILVLGFRGMRRPGEFASFKRKHLWKDDAGRYNVSLMSL